MTIRSCLYILIPSVTILMPSCILPTYRYVYKENMANLLPLKEKGDAVVSGNFTNTGDNQTDSWGPSMNGYDFQAGYALIDQLSVLGSFSNGWANYSGTLNALYPYDSCHLKYSSSSWSLGFQYMLHVHKSVYFAPSVGLGGSVFGLNDIEYSYSGTVLQADPYSMQNRLFQAYIQPAIYSTHKIFDVGFGVRLTFNNFTHVNTSYTEQEGPDVSVLNIQGSTLTTAQVFCVTRLYPGTRGVCLQFHIGNGIPLGGSGDNYRGLGLYTSFGIAVSPYQFLKKKSSK